MEVPDELRRTVIAWFGDDGRRWCDTAPAVAARLIDTWELRPGAILQGATHALVLACTRADGSPAVLKLPFVDRENRAEAEALRLYDGDGAVRLLDHDPACGALLLERLVPGTPLLDLPDRTRALDIACGLLRRLRRPPPKGPPLSPAARPCSGLGDGLLEDRAGTIRASRRARPRARRVGRRGSRRQPRRPSRQRAVRRPRALAADRSQAGCRRSGLRRRLPAAAKPRRADALPDRADRAGPGRRCRTPARLGVGARGRQHPLGSRYRRCRRRWPATPPRLAGSPPWIRACNETIATICEVRLSDKVVIPSAARNF